MTIIGIDPGKSGAIASCARGGTAATWPMPENPAALADVLREILCEAGSEPVRCYLEKVGAMPGQGVTSMFTFGQNYGTLQGALAALSVPYVLVPPKDWQRGMALPRDKKQRKCAVRDAMAARYPHLHVTLGNADALAIMVYGQRDSQQGDTA